VAKEALEPEKNIRPVRSAMISMRVLCISSSPVSLSQAETNLAVGVINYIFCFSAFYDILIEKEIRGILE
jgi:hypothetical protein